MKQKNRDAIISTSIIFVFAIAFIPIVKIIIWPFSLPMTESVVGKAMYRIMIVALVVSFWTLIELYCTVSELKEPNNEKIMKSLDRKWKYFFVAFLLFAIAANYHFVLDSSF